MTQWLLNHFIKDNKNTKDNAVRVAIGSLAGWVGIFCNLLLVVGKATVGLVSGSVSVTADALNNLLDAVSSIILLIGYKISSKQADEEHPFGHGRYEYISGFIVAVLILVVGIELGKSSIEKVLNPTPVEFGLLSFIVLGVSVLLKMWMFVFNRSLGKRTNSKLLKVTSADSRNDAIATSAVLLAAIISRFAGINLDGWMGLGVGVFIIFDGIMLVKESLNPLLGEAPQEELIAHIFDKISEYEDIIGAHDLIVHDYGPGHRFASAHVEISSELGMLSAHEIVDTIEHDFLLSDGIHLIIHIDPIDISEKINNKRLWVECQVKTVDERLSIHDLNIEENADRITYSFDVLAPLDIEIPEQQLREQIEKALQREDKPVELKITIDHSHAETLR